MSEPSTQIERRERGDALSQIVGTGDTRAMLEQVERNVRDIIDVARARGFVRKYGAGENQREFYGEPAWALLGMTYGLVPFVEWTKPVDNGWEARAVVRTREGDDVSSAEAMCTRAEQNRRNADDHTLRAMAQTRARRNALRSALGAALVLAGFDFPDPEAPATNPQVGILHQLERDLGWTHDDGHEAAGVASYKDLSREQAAELIDQWQALKDVRPESRYLPTPAGASSPEATPPGDVVAPGEEVPLANGEGAAAPTSGVTTDTDGPATAEQWKVATKHGLKSAAVLRRARELFPDAGLTSAAALTKHELAAAIEALL